MKSRTILFVSSQQPFKGGMSTTAYNLAREFSKHSEVYNIFYLHNPQVNCDPLKQGNVFTVKRPGLNIILRIVLQILFILTNISRFNTKRILADRFEKSLKKFVMHNSMEPDIVICNVPMFFNEVNKVFSDKKVILLVNGCSYIDPYWNQHFNANTLIKPNQDLSKLNNIVPVKFPVGDNFTVVFNSALTRNVYKALKFYTGSSVVKFCNIVPAYTYPKIDFAEREFDLAFVISNFNRKVKNVNLAIDILKQFPDKKKVIIGEYSNNFAGIPNLICVDWIYQNEVFKYLSNTKLVLITSYYDSSPGTQVEALNTGANVLVSKNVGWNEYFPECAVVNNYFHKDEWITKANALMNKKADYSKFESMIQQKENSIIDFIEKEIH